MAVHVMCVDRMLWGRHVLLLLHEKSKEEKWNIKVKG